mgnify:CR=1 FL=1
MFNKMIRIFISSTFVNFVEERNSLVDVFNELNMFCKSAGFSFQVLDLRWGITDEDSRNNRTLQICLDEITRCQMLSPKPNFLILSGLYYGWIPLPLRIAKDIWDGIADKIPASSPLRSWYLQDTNDVECAYVLRPRKDKECNQNEWKETEETLKKELFPLIHKYFPDKNKYYDIWGLSATEQEIYKGLFCCPENKEHVFILMRTKEPESCPNPEPENMQAHATALQAHLKDTMGRFSDTNILSYQPGDNYTKQTKNFLKQIIQRRIDETLEEEALDLFQREQRLLVEAVNQSEKDYMDINHNLENFLEFCKSNCGKAALLTGESGNGKSTLLKHCYHTVQEYIILSCADILPSCSSITHALWFCLKQLEAKGLIPTPEIEPDAGQCTIWFEKQLKDFHSHMPVTILLDSVDQIYDWNQIGGSLLECKLPEQLTLIISCISKSSLNKRDCKKNVNSYQLQPLADNDSICFLEHLLHNRGRILCEKDKSYIFSRIPHPITPLYMQTLCKQIQKRHSFDSFPIELPNGTQEIIYNQLKIQSHNYPVLYCHAIGYLALAADGLSEQELLALLERDTSVNEEVMRLSHWKTKQKSFSLSVLWSRIFYELKDYLSEADSNGLLLLRFHHALARKAAMKMVGQKLLIKLSRIMSSYFQEEPIYLNRTKNAVIVNTRKLRELFPALSYQNNWKAVADLLTDPEYADGYLRCGWYKNLMLQFTALGQRKYLNDKHKKILSLLQRKAMQFQLWGDSLLPAATETGLYSAENAVGLGWQYVLRYKPQPVKHEKILQNMFHLPNAANAKIGVKEDGTLAIIDGKVLKRYDLSLNSEIYPRCYIDVTNAFLYWKGNRLFVRDNFCRITFWDTGNELILENKEKAPSLVDLYSDNMNKVIRAGGLDERDNEGYRSDTMFQYQSNGTLKDTELFYPDVESIRCFCHKTLCAVLLNQRTLEIIDLDKRLLLASYPARNACFIYWNPQGTEILVVYERDKVQRYPCSYEDSQPLAKPSALLKKHARAYRNRIGRKEVLTIFQFSCPVNKQDTPAYTDSVLGSRQPMYAAFSMQNNRLACYYYYLNKGIIRLFQLNDRELLAESTVDPIFWNDSAERPLYFNAEGSKLILISRGRQHIWDMKSLKWSHQSKTTTKGQIEFVHYLQQKYTSCIEPWLPSIERASSRRVPLYRVLRKAVLILLSPLIRSSQINRDYAMLIRKRIQQIPVVKNDCFWWILDCYHSMIHVCDKNGHWLCHEQLSEEFFDFNLIGDNVYLLPVSLSEPICLQLSLIDALDFQTENTDI